MDKDGIYQKRATEKVKHKTCKGRPLHATSFALPKPSKQGLECSNGAKTNKGSGKSVCVHTCTNSSGQKTFELFRKICKKDLILKYKSLF